VVDVAVNSAGNHNNSCIKSPIQEILGKVNAICQSVSGAYQHKTTQAEFLAPLKCLFLLLLRSQFIWPSSDVVDAAKVNIVLEGLLRHGDMLTFYQSFNTVDKSNQVNIAPLLSESNKPINYVICTWSLSSQVNKTNLELLLVVNYQELFI
jgi:hypothetical protein